MAPCRYPLGLRGPAEVVDGAAAGSQVPAGGTHERLADKRLA